jgi:nucleoporin NUP159
VFLMIHTPSNFDTSSPPQSVFHVVTRQLPEYMFQKVADPASPYGLNRSPPHHFLLRLRDFPPNLQDLLIVASTASVDIGLISRSNMPLAADKPADKITGVFTFTEMSDDSRRAQLSMAEDMSDTSPIGVVLDLSSQVKVTKPIPSDEMDESSTPIPALMVLNNEGILASWWVIYSDSVRQGTMYPGLVAAGVTSQQIQQTPSSLQGSTFGKTTTTSAFSHSAFGTPSNSQSAFSAFKPTTPAFGSPTAAGASGPTAFGAASGLSKGPSVWGSPALSGKPALGSAFGTPAFGSMSAPASQGVAFGSSALPGNRTSPWATGSASTQGSAFGQSSGLGTAAAPSPFGPASNTRAFGSGGGSNAPSGGFASFANTGGFAAATANGGGGSVFGSKPEENVVPTAAPKSGFGIAPGSSFGGANGKEVDSKTQGLFGGQGFTLGSTFKPDGSAKDDGPKPAGSSLFGSSFGNALGEAQKAPMAPALEANEADMDADEVDSVPGPRTNETDKSAKPDLSPQETPASINPVSGLAHPKFQFPNVTSPGSLFGTSSLAAPTSVTTATSKPTGFSVGSPLPSTPATSEKSAIVKKNEASTLPEKLEIKKEPASDNEGQSRLSKYPDAPLPPDTTSKSSYAAGESSVSSNGTDAPLPPDWNATSTSNKLGPQEKGIKSVLDNVSKITHVAKETSTLPDALDAPLPPDWSAVTSSSMSKLQDELPKPSSSGASNQPEPESTEGTPSGPEEASDESGEYESNYEESESGEGDFEDVTKDLSPVSGSNATPGFTPQDSFRSKEEHSFSKVSRPQSDVTSRSLFGEIGSRTAPILAPPKHLSPRSPSPVRMAIPGRLLRPDASRSVSAPGAASQILGLQNPSNSRQLLPSSSTFELSAEQQKAKEHKSAEIRARKEAEESQALIDEEDESIQNFLKQEIIGTKKLDDFVAHQDYDKNKDSDSIPAQVEAVYRDINSMIDTLGINSNSLKSFIKGQSEINPEVTRTRDNLNIDEEWCMEEIKTLSVIVGKKLATQLEQGRVKDLNGKIAACEGLEKDLMKLRIKHDDIKALVASQLDQEHTAVARSKPLSAEQTAQQHDLRRDFTKFQKLLAEAEEGLIVLRSQLVSQSGKTSKFDQGPTVEAVMRTIMKMTTMAEKRSGDIDVLENQMRKLRFSSTARNGSREGSPFTTPGKSSIRSSGTSSMYGLFYTPDSMKETPHGLRNSISSQASPFRGTPPRKKLSGYTAEDKIRIKVNSDRRKEVADKLKGALQKSGIRVRGIDDE